MKSFDEFGVENCKMVLMEERPCQNRKQLKNREGEYLRAAAPAADPGKKKTVGLPAKHHASEGRRSPKIAPRKCLT